MTGSEWCETVAHMLSVVSVIHIGLHGWRKGVDTRRTSAARSAVVRAVGDALSKAGVYYSMPPTQPFPDALAPRGGAGDEERT